MTTQEFQPYSFTVDICSPEEHEALLAMIRYRRSVGEVLFDANQITVGEIKTLEVMLDGMNLAIREEMTHDGY